MIVVAGTITFDASKAEQARAAGSAMMAATHAEPGNIEYAFSIDMADPAVIRVFEVWETQEALNAHFSMPHMAEFQAAVADLGFSGSDISKYEVSSVGPLR